MLRFRCPKCPSYLELNRIGDNKWELVCISCGYKVPGELFNEDDFDEMERMAESIEDSTNIYIRLRDFTQITQLIALFPELEDMSFGEIKNRLIEHKMKWPVGNIYSVEMKSLEQRANTLGLEVIQI